jgi:nucleotide-binding universal stress UspA family protein
LERAADPIVVGVDGSTSTRSTLRWAADEARARGVALVAVHVWEPNRSGQGLVRMARNAWAFLERILTDAADDLIGVEVRRVVESGTPAAVLLTQAAKAAMLVIGSSRGTDIGERTNSVASVCVRYAVGPIVLVPDHSTASWSSDLPVRTGLADNDPGRTSPDGRRAGVEPYRARVEASGHAAAVHRQGANGG